MPAICATHKNQHEFDWRSLGFHLMAFCKVKDGFSLCKKPSFIKQWFPGWLSAQIFFCRIGTSFAVDSGGNYAACIAGSFAAGE